MPQHRRGHEPGPKQNLRRTAEPCLLARPQCSLGKNWSISRPDSYESNGLIFMVNIPIWSWARRPLGVRS